MAHGTSQLLLPIPARGMAVDLDADDLSPDFACRLVGGKLDETFGRFNRDRSMRLYAPTASAPCKATWDWTARTLLMKRWKRADGTEWIVGIFATGTTTKAKLYVSTPANAWTWTLVTGPAGSSDQFDISLEGEYGATMMLDTVFITRGFADANGLLISNGTTWKYANVLAAPTAGPTLTPGAGGNVNGVVQYVYTFYDPVTNSESPPSPATSATVSAKIVALSVIQTLAGMTRKIYRTTDAGGTFRFLAELNTSDTTYSDNISDSGLGYESPPTFVGRAPTSRFCCEWNSALVVAGDAEAGKDNDVYISEPLKPLNFTLGAGLSVANGDGDRITGICVSSGNLCVFKEHSIHEISGYDASTWSVRPISQQSDTGCVAPQTIVPLDDGIFFYSHKGPQMLRGATIESFPAGMEKWFRNRPISEASRVVRFSFTQNDVVTDFINFRLKVYTNIGRTALLGTYETATSQVNWTADGAAFPAAGVELDPGETTYPTFTIPTSAAYGVLYVTVEAYDGTEYGNALVVTVVGPADEMVPMGLNWALRARYFAFYHAAENAILLFAASRRADFNDIAWRINRTTNAVTTHQVHATAGCVLYDFDPTDEPSGSMPILGDANGATWILGAMGTRHRDTAPTSSWMRTGSGTATTATTDVPVTLTRATGTDWPTAGAGLKGEQVVLRDATTGFIYTGLITANTNATLTLSKFYEGRVPPAGTYTWWIGGHLSEIILAWTAARNPNVAKQLKQLQLEVEATGATIYVEARGTGVPGPQLTSSRQEWNIALATATLDKADKWIDVAVRGNWLQIVLRCVQHDQTFSIGRIVASVITTKGAR